MDLKFSYDYEENYSNLLSDPRWKAKKKEILERDNRRCIICNSDKNLQVHHRQYQFSKALNKKKDPWEYENFLLITLCENCHTKGHQLFKVPFKQDC